MIPRHEIDLQADDLVDEFPDADLAYLAAGLESKSDAIDDGQEMALAIAAELRRRAFAGVRKWPSERNT